MAIIAASQFFPKTKKAKPVNIFISPQFEVLFGIDTSGELIREFEENYPNLRIQTAAQETADIIFFDDGEFAGLVNAAEGDPALVSLSPYIDTETRAIPLVSFADLFFYNIDILKAVNRDRPPKTRAEFLAAARAVSGSGARSGARVYGLALGLSQADPLALRRDIYPWIWANGGDIHPPDTGGAGALPRAAADIITFLGQLNREGLLAPGTFEKTGAQRLEEFARGEIAMMAASARVIPFLQALEPGINFGITAIPAAAQGTNRLGLSEIYAGISGACTLPDEAWAFLAFITEKKETLAAALGAVPGSLSGAFPGSYITESPLYSKAWDIFEAADIVEHTPGQPGGEEIDRMLREKLSEALSVPR